ncbi:hypothetical protein P879_08973 [Paragonimus westermani]|uniref:Mitochondrial thiamine pyrophosphate carrier n=1 Tax=Paragonimus westermani TaxID=34504 RepID=A0A8T0D8E6_9TREM|nr:hypothetical protein P879_08973 [Paragonimus westermani]
MTARNVDGSLALSKNDYLIAGSLSGLVARAIVQPLDVLKIRFQLQVEPISETSASKYRGFLQAIRCISKEEGTVAFWKGHLPAQLQAVTFSAIQFTTFEVLAAWLVRMNVYVRPNSGTRSPKPSGTIETFLCGSFAGSFAAGLTQPLDVLRTRFIAQGEPKLYQGMIHAAVYIASHEGVHGFFRGLVPSLLLIAPQTGLQFAIYHTFNQVVQTLHRRWPNVRDEEPDRNPQTCGLVVEPGAVKQQVVELCSVSPLQSLVSGGLAGMGSKCVIYPLDMIKKRMQVHGFEEARVRFGRIPIASSVRHCLISIWNTEGAAALFKGLRPTLLKSCVSISCRFTAYEQFCRLLYHIRNSDKSGRTF